MLAAAARGEVSAEKVAITNALSKPRIHPAGEMNGRTHGQRMHHALDDVCDRQLRAGDVPEGGGIPATVIVTIDADDLTNRVGYGRTGDGALLPTAKLLQLANNADIIPAVLSASGVVRPWPE